MQQASRSLCEFSGGTDEPRWIGLNDDVMGGRSSGAVRIADGLLHFSGTLSLEHGGGFASIRSEGRCFDLRGANALLLRLRGDGLRYQMRLATDAQYRGAPIWYGAPFDTIAARWIAVRIPLAVLMPRHRGRLLPGPPLDVSRVERLGLLIGDRQAGPFALAVDSIRIE